MALSRSFKETVKARAMRDPEFCEALLEEAANLLHVSRSHLDGLLAAGTISSQAIGSSRLISMEDVVAYKERPDREREPDLENLGENAQVDGLGQGASRPI